MIRAAEAINEALASESLPDGVLVVLRAHGAGLCHAPPPAIMLT